MNREASLRLYGNYHVWMDNAVVNHRATEDKMGSRIAARSVPNTGDQDPNSLIESIVLPWKDLDGGEDTFSRYSFDTAALMTELGVSEELTACRDFLRCDRQSYAVFADSMLDRGVLCLSRGIWYVSTAHSEEEINQTTAAAADAANVIAGSASKVDR